MSDGGEIRIGTRRSRLAIWQTEWVARLLRERNEELQVEVVPVRSFGDRDRTTALHGMARQGVFTKEIEEALLDGRCDLAVHSLKDLPVRTPDGLVVGAILEREDPRDAWIAGRGLTIDRLPEGATVGTSSLRRRSQVLHLRPDLEVLDLRGNVPTRLRAAGVSLDEGNEPERSYDATILAYAGLKRLGLAEHVTEALPTDRFLPAPGQGAVAIELRSDDRKTLELVLPLDDGTARLAVEAEREFLEALGGWCHVPVGALATVTDGGIRLEGMVGDPDGRLLLRGETTGEDEVATGRRLAADLLDRGAGPILEKVIAETTGPPPEEKNESS